MGWITVAQTLLAVFCAYNIFREGWCCERGWNQYGDQCFFINSIPNTRFMSRLHCRLKGSDLVSISDNDTLTYIAQLQSNVHSSVFWVGLHLSPVGGQLEWMNEEKADQPWVRYTEHHIQQSGHIPYFFHITTCFAYNGALVEKYNCSSKYPSICGHPRRNATSHVSCHWAINPANSFVGEATGNCIFKLPEQTTLEGADAACGDYGARFLDLDDVMKDGLNTFYDHHILTNNGHRYWTGLKWNGTTATWSSSGKALDEDFPIPVVNGSGSCITVQFNFSDVLETHLFQTECHDLAAVLCSKSPTQIPLTPPLDRPLNDGEYGLKCPSSQGSATSVGTWKPLSDYCYWETSYETSHWSWYEAERFCQSFEGGHLASFHSKDEEKVGLSFQYGKFAHPYWIGLTLDVETETYKWSDGTTLNYTNWAPGHPDHRDKRMRCVAIDAKETHWVPALCGVHSWLICKVPKRMNWTVPDFPRPTPMEKCDNLSDRSSTKLFYFEGSCYFAVLDSVSWHRAKQYCENEGASLVSVHTDQELEFLLKFLNNVTDDFVHGSSRFWIGLNSLAADGGLRWTDWTPVDYVHWSEGEPNSHMNQERCCNMLVGTGQWSDQNCNAHMGFVCKRKNDTSATTISPSTPDPRVGNCKKGWIAHHDRCYFLGGARDKDRLNWTQALQLCGEQGGFLTSVRDEKDQTFLSYLLQSLRVDAWIGLHDTIQRGRYYWVDNSDMQYTHWAPGEPSLFGVMEDCVKMVYNSLDSGQWRDDDCELKLGYICQSRKDPNLPEPSYKRGLDCLNHEGWLKLEGTCYKMFGSNFLTWTEAESTCERNGGHLVSVFDRSVKTAVSYLATEVNSSFWIGLRYKESNHRLGWLNGRPMDLAFWEKNEPSNLRDDTCFASTLEGFWKKVPCEEVMPFMCQITTGKPLKRKMYTGDCPPSSKPWIPGDGSFCYYSDNKPISDFANALFTCYKYGSQVVSIHSMEENDWLKSLMKPGVKSVYIGLFTNNKGGFFWTDDTAVDFVNWDENEPDATKIRQNYQCVEMMADTLKWRVTACNVTKHYLCKDNKVTLYYEDPQSESLVGGSENRSSATAITAIVIFTTIAIMVIVAAALYYSKNVRNRHRCLVQQESVSFENALYNVNSASMEFHNEEKS